MDEGLGSRTVTRYQGAVEAHAHKLFTKCCASRLQQPYGIHTIAVRVPAAALRRAWQANQAVTVPFQNHSCTPSQRPW
jgi:hypothetical protein